jgi:argininosuccinate lyase
MTLWDKSKKTEQEVMRFTVGDDQIYDRILAPYDVIGSMAHAIMLGETGIIPKEESTLLAKTLADYYPETLKDDFTIDPDEEDIHSHLESHLVKNLGATGKKIHTARSRNDQVMTAMQLMMKEECRLITREVISLFDILADGADKYRDILIPGYTHTQIAMPSSFGIWLGAYAESLVNDMHLTSGIIHVLDQNPLGTAAGYGSSFPVDRELTARLAGFSELVVSAVSAQLNRGKFESFMAFGLGSFATTLSRLASDMILFMNQNMAFISFRDELTTGSSIMPHKKNPDVLELIRAHCNTIIQMPAILNGLSANLISGYHRDLQLTKEILIPGIRKMKQSLSMMQLMVEEMVPRRDILEDEKYSLLFSVEEVNRKVMQGIPFRDAYKQVALEIEEGKYKPGRGNQYIHTGSIGNPDIEQIREKMQRAIKTSAIRPVGEVFEGIKGILQ